MVLSLGKELKQGEEPQEIQVLKTLKIPGPCIGLPAQWEACFSLSHSPLLVFPLSLCLCQIIK